MIFEKYQDDLSIAKKAILGAQHTFTMFGATVLVPILTGMDIGVALFMAGVGTLLFHFITKGKVPVFLGSSFAFIAPIIAVAGKFGMPYAQGGIVIAGVVYVLIAILVSVFGVKQVVSFFPPIVTGPIIMVIGLTLAPVAVSSASENWALAFVSFLIVVLVSCFAKGFLKIIPIICGIFGGYIYAAATGLVDFTPIQNAAWFGFPHFQIAQYNLDAIIIIAPVAVATMIEHIGDIAAISATTGSNFMKDPGLHRTLIGDGIATSISALFGGPANTTYSENTGVLALTKVYNPVVMRIAAVFAIILGVIPKLNAIIATIPGAVIGGISIILFGMIAAVGARTLVESKTDFTRTRNPLISAVIFVIGIGGGSGISIPIGSLTLNLSAIALAALVGIALNKILPDRAEKC